jgi:hypothetical protein
MAEYYPLISRAVAGLDKNNGENRRALYERARAALLAQLRGVKPALKESDITRERLALEASIRKVEAGAARRSLGPSPQPPPPKLQPRSPEPCVVQPRGSEPSGSRACEARPSHWGHEPPPNAPPRLYVSAPAPGAQGAGLEARQEIAQRHPPRRPHQDFSEPMLEPSFALDDLPQTGDAPPLLSEEEAAYDELKEEVRLRRFRADLIMGLAVAVVISILAGLVIWHWPNMAALYRAFRAPAQTEAARNNNPSPASPKKHESRIESGQQSSQPAQAVGLGSAAVAEKVVLYEEDPADPTGKRFSGSAIWRTETVTPGPGQPSEVTIRADVEVPERKLAMTWSLRRNTDRGLLASHTVELMFKLPADFPPGGISSVPGILMKQAESTRGVPLAGLAVKVTNGFYLIGLSSADADKERNLQLLKERGWFDIAVVYNDNRRAILAMEKGSPGERAFADAFTAWKQ